MFVGIGGLHVYWAAGGRRGKGAVVPTSGGRAVMAPSTMATVVVAGALVTASGLYVGAAARWEPRWLFRVGAAGAATVLAARAIGDRRYLGFSKRSARLGVRPPLDGSSTRRCAALAVAGATAAV